MLSLPFNRLQSNQLLTLAFCFFYFATLPTFGEAPPTQGKQTVLEIGYDTTRLTEPLDEEGFIDYVLASNQLFANGVTKANNFEVEIRQLLPADEIPVDISDAYFELLGIKPPKGPFGSRFHEWMRQNTNKNADQVSESFSIVLDGPWQRKDFPDIAKWLNQEQRLLDRIVSASRRSRNYTPYVAPAPNDINQPEPHMSAVLLPSIQGHRDLARSLRIRAHYRLGRNDVDGAWQDVLAIMRIGRLADQGITVIESLVGAAIESIAFETARLVLKRDDLTDKQVDSMLGDLKVMPPFRPVATKIDRGERFMALDVIQSLARAKNLRQAIDLIQQLGHDEQPNPNHGVTLVLLQNAKGKPKKVKQPEAFDWNECAKLVNHWIDRTVECSKEHGFKKRKLLFDSLLKDLSQIESNAKKHAAELAVAIPKKPADELGKMVGETLVAMLVPALPPACIPELVAAEQLDVLRVAFAVESFNRRYGYYPLETSDLVSDFADSIPADRFSEQPLQYHRSRNGFVLYSVGRNFKNDLGRDQNDRGSRKQVSWDDIVIRIGR